MWCTVYVIVESTEVQMTWQQPVYIWLGGGKKCSRQAGSCFSTILPFLFSFFIFKQKQDTVPKHSTPPHLLWFLLSTTTMPSCLQLYRGKSKQTCEMALVSNKNKQTKKKDSGSGSGCVCRDSNPGGRPCPTFLSFYLKQLQACAHNYNDSMMRWQQGTSKSHP